MYYWHNIKFNHNKHDAEQLAYGLKVLVRMIGMSD